MDIHILTKRMICAKLTSQLQFILKLKQPATIPPFPVRLNFMVLNKIIYHEDNIVFCLNNLIILYILKLTASVV
jgi:hypothetical protein